MRIQKMNIVYDEVKWDSGKERSITCQRWMWNVSIKEVKVPRGQLIIEGKKNPCKPSAEAIKKCGQILESGS